MLSFKEAKLNQEEALKKYKQEHPELFEMEIDVAEDEVMEKIGIGALPSGRKKGYLRYYTHDFIVEEITPDGELITVEKPEQKNIRKPDEKEKTIYCHMVKSGISHFNALTNLSEYLEIPENKIGYAGIKDTFALTAQRVALRFANTEKITTTDIPGLFLKNCEPGKGTIQAGHLQKNRFTMMIRTDEAVDIDWLKERLLELQTDGYLNYYHIQRFGGLRLSAHKLGAYILQGDFEKAVKQAICLHSEYDIKLIKDLRVQAEKDFPNVEVTENYLKELPIIFRTELQLIEYLKENPEDYKGALRQIPKMVKIWTSAYASYLYNSYLTGVKKRGEKVPKKIPLLLSDLPEDREFYKPWLEKHKTYGFEKRISGFRHQVHLKQRMQHTKIYPEIHKAAIVPGGVIMSFDLPKGSYALTFLMNVFELLEGEPIPEWVQTERYDSKAILGTGEVQSAVDFLGEYAKFGAQGREK